MADALIARHSRSCCMQCTHKQTSPSLVPRVGPSSLPASLGSRRQLQPLLCHVQRQRCCSSRTLSTQDSHVGSLDASGLSIAIVAGRFNYLVTKLLLEGALDAFHRHGGAKTEVVWVPGSFEIPLVAKAMAKSGKFDAVLTIGAVVRGATTHYEAVANSATGGSLNAGLDSGVPVIFGVITTENMEQALDRAGGKAGNKGFECAVTTIEVANLMKSLRQQGIAAEPWGLSTS